MSPNEATVTDSGHKHMHTLGGKPTEPRTSSGGCCRSAAQSCLTLCDPMDCSTPASLSITNSQSSLKLMSLESVMASNHLILSRPLLLPPSICPSIRVFSSESVLCIRWPEYWSFSFSISPCSEYSGLIPSRSDWSGLISLIHLYILTPFYRGKAEIQRGYREQTG